jgi:hypothetical protein
MIRQDLEKAVRSAMGSQLLLSTIADRQFRLCVCECL